MRVGCKDGWFDLGGDALRGSTVGNEVTKDGRLLTISDFEGV